MLLRIKRGVPVLWRDEDVVQLGLDPAHSVVLGGLGAGDRALLDRLHTGVEPHGATPRDRQLIALLIEAATKPP